jgi:hypothetical protein
MPGEQDLRLHKTQPMRWSRPRENNAPAAQSFPVQIQDGLPHPNAKMHTYQLQIARPRRPTQRAAIKLRSLRLTPMANSGPPDGQFVPLLQGVTARPCVARRRLRSIPEPHFVAIVWHETIRSTRRIRTEVKARCFNQARLGPFAGVRQPARSRGVCPGQK